MNRQGLRAEPCRPTQITKRSSNIRTWNAPPLAVIVGYRAFLNSVKMKELFELLAMYGGKIVSTNNLDAEDIKQAKAANRMFVDENSLGYVWMPDILDFPETIEEVELFEKWFPLETEVPKELHDYILECIKKRHEGEDYQDDDDSWSGGFADNH